MHAVFDTKAESAYDDDVSERYHFPARYLNIVAETVGDWVLFRQPRDGGGTKSYFAVGRVERLEPDPKLAGHHYAIISQFLEFAHLAPWRADGRYAEQALREIENVAGIGMYMRGRSVRRLTADDFLTIVRTGLGAAMEDFDASDSRGEAEESRERRVEQALVNRKVRDANFRRNVCEAYKWRCAITGWQLRDHSDLAEVQAAHIWPVGSGGPDVVPNGIALSATVHWLFDRHLISLTQDFQLLASPLLSAEVKQFLFARQEGIWLPEREVQRPSQNFVARHRAIFDAKARPKISGEN